MERLRIAYLILASGDYAHLRRLILALDEEDVHFFIHIDAKSPDPENLGGLPRTTFIPRRKIWWGGWSMVEATLDLMRAAVKEGYDYYALISGADYPIRPNSFLRHRLAGGGEYIVANEGFFKPRNERHVKYYYLHCFERRDKKSLKKRFFVELEGFLRIVAVKRRYPFSKHFHGSQWWVLSRAAVEYILDFTARNKKFVRFFKTSLCSDEAFFPTILGNSPFRDKIKGYLSYIDWSEGKSSPAVISERHMPLILSAEKIDDGWLCDGQAFVARKFNDACAPLLDRIDEARSESGEPSQDVLPRPL